MLQKIASDVVTDKTLILIGKDFAFANSEAAFDEIKKICKNVEKGKGFVKGFGLKQ